MHPRLAEARVTGPPRAGRDSKRCDQRGLTLRVWAHGDHQECLWSEMGAMLSCSNSYLGFLGKCTVLPNLEKNKLRNRRKES